MIKIHGKYSVKNIIVKDALLLIPSKIYPLSPNTFSPSLLPLSEAVVEVLFHEVSTKADKKYGDH